MREGAGKADEVLSPDGETPPAPSAVRLVTPTDRERFLAVVFSAPTLPCDAIVVLAGEDAVERLKIAVAYFGQYDKHLPELVLSGGVSDPPRILSAQDLRGKAMGLGVAPDRIKVENTSQNTREQAVAVARMSKARDWRRIMVVASAYHLPRAVLSFVAAFDEAGISDTCQIVPKASDQSPWGKAPSGCEDSRLDLLTREMLKVEAYRAMGHVAEYSRGIEYLTGWEGK